MRVVIAGGHGKIALRLARLLAARDDDPVGLIRNPDQVEGVRGSGAQPVILDLENAGVDQAAETLSGADAVVFAAGAGPGSGVARKETVDKGGSVLVAEAAERAGVRRFLQISAMGLDRADDPGMDEVFAAYLRAKAAAERDLAERDLDWTILRPGSLTNDHGTGLVTLAPPPLPHGKVTRDDVAGVLLALLDEPASVRRTLELTAGPTPISQAVAALKA